MIYIPSHKLIYAHPPKTAGTSMMMWLNKNVEDASRMGLKHAFTDDILKRFPDANYFLTCRNPYTRIVSWYNHAINSHNIFIKRGMRLMAGTRNKEMTNEKGLEHFGDDFEKWLNKIDWEKPEDSNFDFGIVKKQIYYISKKRPPEFIVRFEHIEKDIQIIKDRFNIQVPYGAYNIAKKVNLKDYYKSDFAIDFVYENFKEDFEYFGYGKDLPL
jgi:hypothetical protein